MKKAIAILLALTIMLSVAACGQTANTSTPQQPSTNTDQAVDTPADNNTDAQAQEVDHRFETEYWSNLGPDETFVWERPYDYKRVGMIVPDGTNEYYLYYVQKIGDAMEEIGYEFVWADGKDTETAINAIEIWVNQGIDALIVGVIDVGCEPAILKAMEKGVLVILTSGRLSSYHVFFTQDSYMSGYNAGTQAAAEATKRFGDDASYITIGMNNAEFQTLKTNGVIDSMNENYPNGTRYELTCNYAANTTQDDVETLLTQHPEIKFVVSWNSALSLMALAACDSLGIKDPDEFAIFGSMLSTQAISELEDPNSIYAGDVYTGNAVEMTVDLLLKILNGEPVTHDVKNVEELFVTKENIHTYLEEYAELYGHD